MTYTEAVKRALNGDSAGFEFLYNATKNNKYFLALKYVNNDEAAKDVLQDAYIRAWQNLDKLADPEKFESWFAKIVVNTAKNELEKRNHTPLDLRADVSDDEDDTEVFDRAVSSWENIPELEYTKEETRQLVHELIDSLSDEQRIVVIAFELEGLTTREIAEQLGCSEATVKSRLRYARNNIKIKAEDLQKKGYKLYSVAPLSLLLLLLRKDMSFYAAEPSVQKVLSDCREKVLKNAYTSTQPEAQGAQEQNAQAQEQSAQEQNTQTQDAQPQNMAGDVSQIIAEDGATAAKKAAFLSTKAGKAVIGIALAVAVGGAVAGIAGLNNSGNEADGVVEQSAQEETTDTENQQEETYTVAESTEVTTTETTTPEETTTDPAQGWSDAYSYVMQHVLDNTVSADIEGLEYVAGYGYSQEIYDNLTENDEKFQYSLVDMDSDGIPELIIGANTSSRTYNGMRYWAILTYKETDDGSYAVMPVKYMYEGKIICNSDGAAAVGGTRVDYMRNEDSSGFLEEVFLGGTGISYLYSCYMEHDEDGYWWRREEIGYYPWEQQDQVDEIEKDYPIDFEWKSIDEPFEW